MAAMKWWGWGVDGVAFTHEDKPELRDFIIEKIGLDVGAATESPKTFDELDLPAPDVADDLRAALVAAVGEDALSDDGLDRVVHARGKSIRDLIRQRRGDLPRIPDLVVRPADEDQVTAVLAAALAADAVVIPFGGGTSISGSLEASAAETRTVLSVDMSRLDQVLEIDEASRLARVQAGVFGPHLEEQLNARGYTFGHYPDSFTHSTLGGWIATRSSGMQSDRYGDIADMVRGLRVVTPAGTLVTRPVPSTSTGPSIREMVLGSEGRLGLITEATVHIRHLPQARTILGYLFPTFQAGLDAMHAIALSDASVSVTRVSDAPETQFSFATRKASTRLDKVQSKALTTFLTKAKGFALEEMCLSFIGYEGSEDHVSEQRRKVGRIVGAHGGLCIGASPGQLYDQKKFDTPYIRDFLLDRGAAADVSETAAPWGRLRELYDNTRAAGQAALDGMGVRGYLMCHLSHSYHAGACLYFTFAFEPAPGTDMIEQYDVVKKAIQQAFVDNGGTLSHHHAVGTEHSEWLEQDISAPGVVLLKALLHGTDPGANLNPGKIV
ncbi:FAD-binding oxidoreductase [Paraconexibacter sp. AEG42_29]